MVSAWFTPTSCTDLTFYWFYLHYSIWNALCSLVCDGEDSSKVYTRGISGTVPPSVSDLLVYGQVDDVAFSRASSYSASSGVGLSLSRSNSYTPSQGGGHKDLLTNPALIYGRSGASTSSLSRVSYGSEFHTDSTNVHVASRHRSNERDDLVARIHALEEQNRALTIQLQQLKP